MCGLSLNSQLLMYCRSRKSKPTKLRTPDSLYRPLTFTATICPVASSFAVCTIPYIPFPIISPSSHSLANSSSSLNSRMRPLGGVPARAKIKATAMAPVSGKPFRNSDMVKAARPTAPGMKAVSRAPFNAALDITSKPWCETRSAGPRASAKVRMPSVNSPATCTSSSACRKPSASPGSVHSAFSPIALLAFRKNVANIEQRAPSTCRSSLETQMQSSPGLSRGHFL
mmetsp:Transcript_65067/g.187238  ORF Transcript_65067/g.187238 Transcript_65067/m.187238 type:complete len:227 (+) Transcript_65067:1549-2229(+)